MRLRNGQRILFLFFARPFCTALLLLLLTAAGEPRREGRRTAGAVLRHARRAKERTYPELCNSGRCRLVVLGRKTGGKWSLPLSGATNVDGDPRILSDLLAEASAPPSSCQPHALSCLRSLALVSGDLHRLYYYEYYEAKYSFVLGSPNS